MLSRRDRYYVIALLVEGAPQGRDRLVTALVAPRLRPRAAPARLARLARSSSTASPASTPQFFTQSMRNVVGEGGGALHAIVGTLLITGMAALISVPIGLLTAIYLVEYGARPRSPAAITFLVDVMTGIPSIVAGLFAYALFALFFGPGIRMGFAGSVALSVLMIPVVVRSSEEMLRARAERAARGVVRARRAEVADDRQGRAADLDRRHHDRRHARRSPASSARRRRC